MGEMADLDYDRQLWRESGLDRRRFTYVHKGKKLYFDSIEEANKWAKSKGFRLKTAPKGDGK